MPRKSWKLETFLLIDVKSGWPSGLRRQTQEIYSSLESSEHSGPRMWAWVRIPLLTTPFTTFYICLVSFLSCIHFENTFEQHEKYCFYLRSMIYGSVQYTAQYNEHQVPQIEAAFDSNIHFLGKVSLSLVL